MTTYRARHEIRDGVIWTDRVIAAAVVPSGTRKFNYVVAGLSIRPGISGDGILYLVAVQSPAFLAE